MDWVYDDGGRSLYFKGEADDCVIRSVAIATGRDYLEVYDEIKAFNKGKSCRNGTPSKVTKNYINSFGFKWVPTMQIGSGCQVHLREDELPGGTLLVSLSGHISCVKDGVIYDTFDCSRDGTRCVYGYWIVK